MEHRLRVVKLWAQDGGLNMEYTLLCQWSWKVAQFITSENNCQWESYNSSSPEGRARIHVTRCPLRKVSFLHSCTFWVCATDRCPFRGPDCMEPESSRRDYGSLNDGNLLASLENCLFLSNFWIVKLNFNMLLRFGAVIGFHGKLKNQTKT